ncbi:MAG: hypothetical protein IKE43_09815 [Coriobacteriales bacterium]|nr:hypothetical protein [Coriobacteriales bacterium]
MTTINVDIDALREYLRDYYGTAVFSGFGPALLDLADIENLSDYELCQKAEDMGIDLRRFAS